MVAGPRDVPFTPKTTFGSVIGMSAMGHKPTNRHFRSVSAYPSSSYFV